MEWRELLSTSSFGLPFGIALTLPTYLFLFYRVVLLLLPIVLVSLHSLVMGCYFALSV